MYGMNRSVWIRTVVLAICPYKKIPKKHGYISYNVDRFMTYFGPADITGQLSSVQNSVIVPYNIFIWLKKSTAGIKMIRKN